MPYQPNSYRKPTDEELKARQYTLFWVAFFCNVGLLALYLAAVPFENLSIFGGAMVGCVVGGLIVPLLKSRTESYYRELAAAGGRWALLGVGIILPITYLAKSVQLFSSVAELFGDPYLVTLLVALLYYLGHAAAWLKDAIGVANGKLGALKT